MTDIPVGWALRNDLVRQVAVPACSWDDAEDLPHTAYLKLVRYRAQMPVRRFPGSHGKQRQPLQDEVVAARIRLTRARAGLDKLPARTREIVMMPKRDGLKYIEISEQRTFPRIAHWRDSSERRGG